MKINKMYIYTTLIAPLIVGVLVDMFTKVEVWKFVSESVLSIWSVLLTIIIWIYHNIVWFEIPLWALVIAALLLNQLLKYKAKVGTSIKEEAKYSLIQIHNEFDEQTKNLFKYFVIQMNRDTQIASYQLNGYAKQNNLTKLEIEDLVNEMINKNLLEGHPNFMEETHFTLSDYGKKIAVALIKQSKVGNEVGNRVSNEMGEEK